MLQEDRARWQVGMSLLNCEFSVRRLSHFTILAPRIWRWWLDFQKCVHPWLNVSFKRKRVCKAQLIFKYVLLFPVSCRFSIRNEGRRCMFHARQFYVVCDFFLLELFRYKYKETHRTGRLLGFPASLTTWYIYIWNECVYLDLIWCL